VTEWLNDRLGTARVVLEAVMREPMRWTPLTKLILQSSTPWKAQATLEWLLKEGYLERPSRGIYRITEMGALLLKALPMAPRDR
jgi:predicted transcriptional regulator